MSETKEENKDAVIVSQKGKRRHKGLFQGSTFKVIERVLQYTPKDGVFHSPYEIGRLIKSHPRAVNNAFRLIRMISEFPYEIEFTSIATTKSMFIKIGKEKIDKMRQAEMLVTKALEILKSEKKEELK